LNSADYLTAPSRTLSESLCRHLNRTIDAREHNIVIVPQGTCVQDPGGRVRQIAALGYMKMTTEMHVRTHFLEQVEKTALTTWTT
jgi:hypothetical protein